MNIQHIEESWKLNRTIVKCQHINDYKSYVEQMIEISSILLHIILKYVFQKDPRVRFGILSV